MSGGFLERKARWRGNCRLPCWSYCPFRSNRRIMIRRYFKYNCVIMIEGMVTRLECSQIMATLVFYSNLLQGMIRSSVAFCDHRFSLPFHFAFTQMRHTLLPRPVRVQQHPSHLILNVKAHLGPVSQAELLNDALPVELWTDPPAPVQVQLIDDGAVQCAYRQVHQHRRGRNPYIGDSLLHFCVKASYVPRSGG